MTSIIDTERGAMIRAALVIAQDDVDRAKRFRTTTKLERQRAVFAARDAGWSFQAIADTIGTSHQTVQKIAKGTDT
jgi:DNA-binding NarL/FixJ family response regulator